MLIKVSGIWINPDPIVIIYDIQSRTNDGGKTYEPDCKIAFIGQSYNDHLSIIAKSADEVAAEINRQIKEASKG